MKLPASIAVSSNIDLGQLCVWCLNDTSFGSGRFVNRIHVAADVESTDWYANLSESEKSVASEVEGFGCYQCYQETCLTCNLPVDLDGEVRNDDGDWFHPECLANRARREEDRDCESCGKSGKDEAGRYPSNFDGIRIQHPTCVDWDDVRKYPTNYEEM